jgi:hypothetical protein
VRLTVRVNYKIVYIYERHIFCILHLVVDHFEGHWKEWALEIKTFLGPEMATLPPPTHTNTYTAAAKLMYIKLQMYLLFIWLDIISGTNKISIFRAPPSNGPQMNLPA